ncbi:MAG: DUF2796 domain-containing protein [Pseudomonadota bacterium]
MRTSTALLALLVVGAPLAACGNEGGGESETPDPVVETASAPSDHSDEDHHADGDHHGDEDHHDDEDHDHDHDHDYGAAGEAHVHGEADLAIVLAGEQANISLLSPLYNLTGFETEPDTPEKARVYAEMTDLLNAAGDRFQFNAEAGCTLQSAEFPITMDESGASAPFDYRDMEASFFFTCADGDALSTMTTDLFERFERLEKIDVIIIDGDEQDATTIESGAAAIELR